MPSILSFIFHSLQDFFTVFRIPILSAQDFDYSSIRKLDTISSKLSSDQLQPAGERIIEMHGSGFKTICTQCKKVAFNHSPSLCPALKTASEETLGRQEIPINPMD